MEIDAIRQAVAKIESKTTSEEWFNSLEDRKKEEAEFHDFSHDEDTALDNKKFYTTNRVSHEYLQNWLKSNSKDKVFLDYACGNGVESVKVAKYGARLVMGIDISPGSVANAKALAEKEGVADKCLFFVGDCENTELPESCIDVVLCAGVLHHMNLDFVYPELQRIMVPGGKLLAVEALNYNPVIRAYRMRTPEMRTDWEKDHILDLDDVDHAKKYFSVEELNFWHLTSFLAAFFRKIPVVFPVMLGIFNLMDSILTKVPYLQRWSWQFTFVLSNNKK